MFCIPKHLVDEFMRRIRSGEINAEAMMAMSSRQRRDYFSSFLGQENARQVNALLESKLILKNQKKGMIAWANSVTGIKPSARRDIIDRINKLDKILTPENESAFYEDLVAHRLGVAVTMEEAGNIVSMAKIASELKAQRDAGGERMPYGRARVKLSNYVGNLKTEAKKMSVSEYLRNPTTALVEAAGLTKAMAASLDNSAIGRQGMKILWTNPEIWAKNSAKSFKDISDTLGGKEVLDEVMADVVSRPNYDKYVKDKLAIGVLEEAFPTHLPGQIPIFGKLFKASEAAYTAFMMRNRADLYDKYTDIASKSGIQETTGIGIGKLVNSLTSRGSLGPLEPVAGIVNNVLFSPRNLKANIDVLTVHAFDKGISPFVRKQAAINLVKIISGTAAVMIVTEAIFPDSIEKDPRSADFGKIKVGDTRFDITGGMSSIVSLASRILPTQHEGKWGKWYKSSTTGKFENALGDKYGAKTVKDRIYDFLENKYSPAARFILNISEGKDFTGKPLSFSGEIGKLFVPLPVQTFVELQKSGASAEFIIFAMIAEELGISTNTYKTKSARGTRTSKSEGL